MMKIWERYFLKQQLQFTLFFLITFYGLYCLIDYANHAAVLYRNSPQSHWYDMALYYGCEFSNRLEVLLPFALLIATIRTLTNLNANNELVALLSSGVSMLSLLRPFVLVGLIATALVYLNSELLEPSAMKVLRRIENSRSKKYQLMQQMGVQQLTLEDGTSLLYQRYNSSENLFFDAYWIANSNQIYRIKYLYPTSDRDQPFGKFVDQLSRNQKGEIVTVKSWLSRDFPEIRFNNKTLFDTLTAPEEQAISSLWNKLPDSGQALSEKESTVMAAFYHKLIMPWLCLFAIIGPAPFCIRFSRQMPIFFIYASAIFALVAFQIVFDSAVVLAERQVFMPLLAIGVPFSLISSSLLWRFSKAATC